MRRREIYSISFSEMASDDYAKNTSESLMRDRSLIPLKRDPNYWHLHPWQRKQVYYCDINRDAAHPCPYVRDASRLFDSRPVECVRLYRNKRGSMYYELVQRSSAAIFASSGILPYAIGTGDGALNDAQIISIYGAYGFNENLVRTVGYIMPVCGAIYIDDLGRFYRCNEYGRLRFIERFVTMRMYDTRPHKEIDKHTLPVYWWCALAGYDPDVKAAIVNSWEYDVHHMEENHFDFRPDHYAIIPTKIHREHHASRDDFDADFFRQKYKLADGFKPHVIRK